VPLRFLAVRGPYRFVSIARTYFMPKYDGRSHILLKDYVLLEQIEQRNRTGMEIEQHVWEYATRKGMLLPFWQTVIVS
jgi:hypothetical protein